MRYAKENGISNTSFYVDDGYIGTNYNRPDFQRMLADIESGKIFSVIAICNNLRRCSKATQAPEHIFGAVVVAQISF